MSDLLEGRHERKLSVLWLGFTRDLWARPGHAQQDTLQRFLGYSRCLSAFHVIAHSLRKHKLASRKKLGDNFSAYATNGYTTVDSWLRMLVMGLRIGRKVRFDLIQAQDPLFSGVIAAILRHTLKIPMSIYVYEANPFLDEWLGDLWYRRLGGPLGRGVLRSAQGVQVDATAVARFLVQNGISSERIYVRPNTPTHLPDFLTAKADVALREELTDRGRFSRLVLFVGRLIPQKNPADVIDLATRVTRLCPGARFVCVGDGPLKHALQRQTERQGMTDHVLWMGALPHQQVVRYMATCDLFILPSLYEGLARVLMEAAAARKPIVTTRVGGADEVVISGETGYVVPVGNREGFAACTLELLQDAERATSMGREGRAHVAASLMDYNKPQSQVAIWARIARGPAHPSSPRE